MSVYNKYYKEQNYFGNPYPELIEYFNKMDRSLKVLDLGCGQGRDVLAIGNLGFSVLGVDVSEVGINQLNQVASRQELDVIGIVSDLDVFDQINQYDVVLMDSMFHFYKRDIKVETARLNRILKDIKVNGFVILIIQENQFRVNHLKNIIKDHQNEFNILEEIHLNYKEFNSEFYMIVIKKTNV